MSAQVSEWKFSMCVFFVFFVCLSKYVSIIGINRLKEKFTEKNERNVELLTEIHLLFKFEIMLTYNKAVIINTIIFYF